MSKRGRGEIQVFKGENLVIIFLTLVIFSAFYAVMRFWGGENLWLYALASGLAISVFLFFYCLRKKLSLKWADWSRQTREYIVIGALLLVVATAAPLIVLFIEFLGDFWSGNSRNSRSMPSSGDSPADKVRAIASILTFVGAIITVFLLHRRVLATEGQLENSSKQLENSAKQVTEERFAAAYKLVGDEKLTARMGGIDLLESLSEYPKENWQRVRKFLGDFLRAPPDLDHYPKWNQEGEVVEGETNKVKDRPDVAKVVAILLEAKNNLHYDSKEIDLHNVHLVGADLSEADLQGANLSEADLREADLSGAKLSNANLWKADLRKADLSKVNLWKTDL